MSELARFLAHPLQEKPYDKLLFVRLDGQGTPLYQVEGSADSPCSAYVALNLAFKRFGGSCFYCSRKFTPQGFSNNADGAHRDHVIPAASQGSDLIHNLVIACSKCGRDKGADEIHEFRPKAARKYLAALNLHISASIRPLCWEQATPSSPLPPKPASAAGP